MQPDMVIYNAGTDILDGDPLGRMRVSAEGVAARDMAVFEVGPLLDLTQTLAHASASKCCANVTAETCTDLSVCVCSPAVPDSPDHRSYLCYPDRVCAIGEGGSSGVSAYLHAALRRLRARQPRSHLEVHRAAAAEVCAAGPVMAPLPDLT